MIVVVFLWCYYNLHVIWGYDVESFTTPSLACLGRAAQVNAVPELILQQLHCTWAKLVSDCGFIGILVLESPKPREQRRGRVWSAKLISVMMLLLLLLHRRFGSQKLPSCKLLPKICDSWPTHHVDQMPSFCIVGCWCLNSG